jgi:S1-C subfamily serine protease
VTALGQTISNPVSLGHRISGLIAADNSIVPGESGGPMLNRMGEVVGMNDAYELAGTDRTPTGVGFAVPISAALHGAHALLLRHQQATQLDTRA